jgi:DNA-binding XRE family transcriptional regulator
MCGSLGAQRLDAPSKTIRRMEPDQEQPSMQCAQKVSARVLEEIQRVWSSHDGAFATVNNDLSAGQRFS